MMEASMKHIFSQKIWCSSVPRLRELETDMTLWSLA